MYKNILFLCTGNACRSPMAEGILKDLANKHDIIVSSAGTHAFDGFPASELSVRIMKQNGIDISGHNGQLLNRGMVEGADIIFAMSEEHIEFMKRNFPLHEYKTHLLRQFRRSDEWLPDPTIFDPIGGDESDYMECFSLLKKEIARIFPKIIEGNVGAQGTGDISN